MPKKNKIVTKIKSEELDIVTAPVAVQKPAAIAAPKVSSNIKPVTHFVSNSNEIFGTYEGAVLDNTSEMVTEQIGQFLVDVAGVSRDTAFTISASFVGDDINNLISLKNIVDSILAFHDAELKLAPKLVEV